MMAANGLHKINLALLRKDLLYLCGALKHFPTEGDDGDGFAGGDNPDGERRQVFNYAKLQVERLLKTLEGVEQADCNPVEIEILIDLRARLRHLLKIELHQRNGEAVTLRLWSDGPLPPLERGTLPAICGAMETIRRSLDERAEDSGKNQTPALKDAEESNPKTTRNTVEERALQQLVIHPDWKRPQIAKQIGCSERSLAKGRCPKLNTAMQAFEQRNLPRGSKSHGRLEVIDEG
jgi:hypothetical protein